MDDASDRLSSRYGAPGLSPRTRRRLLVLGAILFAAVVVFLGIRFADQPVRAQVVSYEHLDESHVRVGFTVTRDPGVSVTCTVQAMNEGRAQVGFVEVDLPATQDRQTGHEVDIATQGDAVSAEVIGCDEA